MDALITLSEESVPQLYFQDSLPDVQFEYGVRLYTKSEPDEKEISQVYVRGERKERVGWMIPVLSMISMEHGESENKFFRKHVYEALKLLNGQELHESVYVLVYSKRLLESVGVESDGELTLSFVQYGVYPYYSHKSLASVAHKLPLKDRVTIAKGFNFDLAVGFFKFFSRDLLPAELNSYARFMFFYQVYELAMEMIFYKKVNQLKITRSHLGVIRKRIEEYSSEGKLIGVLYGEMGLDGNDPDLARVANSIFEDLKDRAYYSATNKSAMLYDIRNTLVHSYYRYNVDDNILYLASYIEDEAFHVLNYLYSDEAFRGEIEEKYFYANT